jgi:hypothetical protein
MNRQQILQREREYARVAAFAAILAAPLYIVSSYLRGTSPVVDFTLATEQFRVANDESGALLVSALLGALGVLVLVIPLLYLFKAAQARSERVSAPMVGFVFIGPVLLAVALVLSALAQRQIAEDFVAQAAGSGDVYTLLDDLIDDSSLASVGSNLVFPGVLGTIVALVYVPLQALRVGLLSRFFATLGMALGVALILIPYQYSLLAVSIWFAWLGFLFLDRVPNGRPPAWAAGEAIPWPRPGDQAPAEPQPAVVEGDASEVFAEPDEPVDHSARRDRARKRKRKRRR